MEFIAQCLPPGQDESAASIRRPGDKHHLLSAQRREVEIVAVDVGQHEVRCFSGDQCVSANRFRSERPHPLLLVVNEGHPQPFGSPRQFEPARERNAHVTLARSLGLDLPASSDPEGVGVNIESIEDHATDGSQFATWARQQPGRRRSSTERLCERTFSGPE